MNVSLVIPVFNQVHLTERCLTSVLKNSFVVKEVFVVNNASQDSTAEFLEKIALSFSSKGVHFEVITNEKNVGFGRACNQGIRKSTQAFVAILNNDTWVMPNWDTVLVQKIAELKVDCVGPYFYEKPSDEITLLEIAKEFTTKNKSKVREHFVPILMFFNRLAITQLQFDHGGIFDERFFVTYEDTDLKYRMKAQGMKWAQTAACFIWHHSMGTRNAKGMLPSGYEQEGLRLFIEKWGFDPRPAEHTFFAKLKRRYWKWKESRGEF